MCRRSPGRCRLAVGKLRNGQSVHEGHDGAEGLSGDDPRNPTASVTRRSQGRARRSEHLQDRSRVAPQAAQAPSPQARPTESGSPEESLDGARTGASLSRLRDSVHRARVSRLRHDDVGPAQSVGQAHSSARKETAEPPRMLQRGPRRCKITLGTQSFWIPIGGRAGGSIDSSRHRWHRIIWVPSDPAVSVERCCGTASPDRAFFPSDLRENHLLFSRRIQTSAIAGGHAAQ